MALLSLPGLDDEGFVLYKADVVEAVEQTTKSMVLPTNSRKLAEVEMFVIIFPAPYGLPPGFLLGPLAPINVSFSNKAPLSTSLSPKPEFPFLIWFIINWVIGEK